MRFAVELIVSGIAIGAIYGLMAMAFALTYRATGLLNFAQGEIGMLIAYLAWSFSTAFGAGTLALLAAALGSSVLIGMTLERFIMRRMLGQPVFSAVLVTVGIGVMISSLVLLIWGGEPKAIAVSHAGDIVSLGYVRIRMSQIGVVVVLLVSLAATAFFFKFSRFGIAMQAVAADERTARLMGISPARVQAVAWVVSSFLAGLAGLFFAVTYELSPTLFALGLKSFPATVFGGLDAVVGSGASGIILGIVENLAGGYVSSEMKELAGFLMILAVLMVRPFGMFGQRDIERV